MSTFNWTSAHSASTGTVCAGIGLRAAHHDIILDQRPEVGFLEIHAENVMHDGAAALLLDQLAEHYPISIHGVGLSLAGPDPLNRAHLRRWQQLIERYQPAQISEHLAWSVSETVYHNDLLPIPYTEEALDHVTERVHMVQDFFKRPVLIENPSTYLEFTANTIPEWEFLATIVARTGCGILLDVNNIIVAQRNHGYDPLIYLEALPRERIGEIHLAGHAVMDVPLANATTVAVHVDDHGSAVDEDTWALYTQTIAKLGPTPTLIEWDSNIPDLDVLVAQAHKADQMAAQTIGQQGLAT